jgi:hypothetical protein
MSVVQYYARRAHNPYWAWWAAQWGMKSDASEPVLAFLRSAGEVQPKPPSDLPASKVFRGTGLAILNTTLLDSAGNVQVRFKSSPFGRQSHGHDPHNSFTLNAYGEQLLVNNVYRDLYGSPFHKLTWETRSQNALLVGGVGQKVHSPEPFGKIVRADIRDGLDWITGDAAQAYEGKLTQFLRHVVFVKPDVVLLVDEVATAQPAALQWMLHGLEQFQVSGRHLELARGSAGVLVDYLSSQPLKLTQTDGYDPPPGTGSAAQVERKFPNHWHVEASTGAPVSKALVITVMRPYRKGQEPKGAVTGTPRQFSVAGAGETVQVTLPESGGFAVVRKGARTWRLTAR